MAKRKNTGLKKILAVAGGIVLIGGIILGYFAYRTAFGPNVDLEGKATMHIYIPTGSTYEDVLDILEENRVVANINTFAWLAEQKNYPNRVMPGRYLIHEDMNNNELINLLRSGKQDPVNITFNNIHTRYELAAVLSRRLEADSAGIIGLMDDPEAMQKYELTPETAKLMFIPNTYEFYWNTTPSQILDRMHREYNNFWNNQRRRQAENINLTPQEVGIMASIVQRETSKRDEMDRIAGVYMNRIKRNIPLQADPTVIFALGDMSINRVLKRHLEIDSPYNTYRNTGLPPGPITLPEPYVIDQVLNYENHEYLFFCALDDFSGYHAFAKTYREHLNNARRYRQALNERRIMR